MALFARCLIHFAAIYVTELSPIGDTRVVKPALYGIHSCTHTYCTLAGRRLSSNVCHIKAVYLMSPSSIFFAVRKPGSGVIKSHNVNLADRIQATKRSSPEHHPSAPRQRTPCALPSCCSERNDFQNKTGQNPRLTLKVPHAAGAEG